MKPPVRRCAIYTRKSSEEGLDQAFNSLDAQREAGEAYGRSQASEGWQIIATPYDDGGYSGGSMERPALRQLLADIAAGLIDVVIVYKIDRLTRSLADFARMVELFDTHEVSFVSVTQAFNTTSSMGRLTLNVLLSFAQFEREVTGERIRDKIAASKARGMWMGGAVPLGYDLPTDADRALVVNEAEAHSVRLIFATYLDLGSVHALERWLGERGIRSKLRITRAGKTLGGQALSRGALFHMLRNRTYLGLILHRDQAYPGAHPAIVDQALFDKVGAMLDANARRQESRRDHVVRAPLVGRLFDCDGQPMTPTFSHGARGTVYRYMVSAPLQQGRRKAPADNAVRRVPAEAIERLARVTLERLLPAQDSPLDIPTRIELHRATVEMLLPVRHLNDIARNLRDGESAVRDPLDRASLRLTLPLVLPLRGGRRAIEAGEPARARRDPVLIKALRNAHRMLTRDAQGMPQLEASPTSPYQRSLLRLAFLAPQIQQAILAGTQPRNLTLERLMTSDVPPCWTQQISAFMGD